MTRTDLPEPGGTAVKPVASVWHTLMVLLILAGLDVVSAFHLITGPLHALHVTAKSLTDVGMTPRELNNIISITVEWLLIGIIWLGLRSRGFDLRTLTGGAPRTWGNMALDFGLAVAFLLAADIIIGLLAHALHASPGASVKELIPQGNVETAFYLCVAATAGICEEIIFRGYLQRQFTAWSRNAVVGVVIQGVLFGAAHGYQGPRMMGVIAVYGCLFGLLALWRKTLRPGIIAHILQDSLAGLVLSRFAPK